MLFSVETTGACSTKNFNWLAINLGKGRNADIKKGKFLCALITPLVTCDAKSCPLNVFWYVNSNASFAASSNTSSSILLNCPCSITLDISWPYLSFILLLKDADKTTRFQ